MAPSCAQIGYRSTQNVSKKLSWKHQPKHDSKPASRGHRDEEWLKAVATPEADPQERLKALFEALAEEWKSDTWHISSVRKRISHPSYLKIIGMGKDALQFIFDDMRKEPSHWFWALEAITREDVSAGTNSMSDLHAAWLEWGKAHGY